ncbi:trafficking protein particle complex subunit 8, putative [Plasmodium knowlesi strain H]|uniref:Trafficking protein particle complex subunit 8, putative n=3 Tax=Plasmodium knowlesi TaxID=5850 RepID=A0A5K1VR03_PLAKH|nr:trafficking protein particle complex subunit 8, putative [Plasmodium knowlesi strain H]OTN67174.1 putative Trafficking protein particle complex subunit 8 [Plasmodium knowlesi]CAA9988789.1 trafficking protein particle complex subunit 8, putative [Plasmodium knowlesi strain H]SBO21752.1 trafficking protein particle complex subunit 8, putative [Plasmodium knowlesi strain H]SBO22142.1 trafficking protein particle complex subunit 8, putative [Plasmodium knowlesi strain H]VVS78263.1 trafficking p|eukprot:XP_002259766.1 hypothetical protein, conserved in Plasmodium species [Plasmodium knowlesi strain H]
MAKRIEAEIRKIIGDIYVSTILISSSRIAKREVALFLGISINDLFQPFGCPNHLVNDKNEQVDLTLSGAVNINYLNKNNVICQKVVEYQKIKLQFVNLEEYIDVKLDSLDRLLIDSISHNEPDYTDIYNEENLSAYFAKNNQDCAEQSEDHFNYICANSNALANHVKKEVLRNSAEGAFPSHSVYSERVVQADSTATPFSPPHTPYDASTISPLGHCTGRKESLSNVHKYNAFFLPWFRTYLKTAWKYTHMFSDSSCTPLGLIYIGSTRDENVVDTYKSMIQKDLKKEKVGIHAHIPKCIILLHISSNHDDDIETDVQKLFVKIQSTFPNFKCHLLIIKAHRFLNKCVGGGEKSMHTVANDKVEHIIEHVESIPSVKRPSDDDLAKGEVTQADISYEGKPPVDGPNRQNVQHHGESKGNDPATPQVNSKESVLGDERLLSYTEINTLRTNKNKLYQQKDTLHLRLNRIQELYVDNLGSHFSDRTEDGIKTATSMIEIEEMKKVKTNFASQMNSIYEYIFSDQIIYISKKDPLHLDEAYFCCCLEKVDIISLKMFFHNFVQICVIPYMNTITYDINHLILRNRKTLRNQLKFMWKRTKLNFSSSDAALLVAEQTGNAFLNVAQNVLAPSSDTTGGANALLGKFEQEEEKVGLPEDQRKSIPPESASVQRSASGNSAQMAGGSTVKAVDAVDSVDMGSVVNPVNPVDTVEAAPMGDAKNYNKEPLEHLYKTLSDVYFILGEYELAYNTLKICINEFKHEKLYFYLGNIYKLTSLSIFNMDNQVNKKDSLYYLDLSYQMFSKCQHLNYMFICSILNYYLSLILDEKNEASVNILINANVDFTYLDEKLIEDGRPVGEGRPTKLSFQINNIRSGLLLEQITYSYKKRKKKKKKKKKSGQPSHSMANYAPGNEQITNSVDKFEDPDVERSHAGISATVGEDHLMNRQSEHTHNLLTKGNITSGEVYLGDASEEGNQALQPRFEQNYNWHHYEGNENQSGDSSRQRRETSEMFTSSDDYDEGESHQSVNRVNRSVENTLLLPGDSDEKIAKKKNDYKRRKYLFEMTLAGHTFNKCGFKKLALFCYSKVLKKYEKKKMKHIYEHLHFMMARQAFSINLYYEALNHYICILNSIAKSFEHSYILNGHVDIYYASPDKEINFIREFAYVYKIYVDRVLNRFFRRMKDRNAQVETQEGNQLDQIHNSREKPNHTLSNEATPPNKLNRMVYFQEDNEENIIKPLNLRIPLVHIRDDEGCFLNSIYISKTNIYTYQSRMDSNFYEIIKECLFKMNKYDTTIDDLFTIMAKEFNDLSLSNLHELNYLHFTYKKFINCLLNDSIECSSSEFSISDGAKGAGASSSEATTSTEGNTDNKSPSAPGYAPIISINATPFLSSNSKECFITYIHQLKKKFINCHPLMQSVSGKNIYQGSTTKEETIVNTKFVQYASKGEFIFVTFKLVNPLHTKVECQGAHICAHYHNGGMNNDIEVEKRVIILEARETRVFTLFLRPQKRGLLFISGITWHLFGLVKVHQNFFVYGMKKLNKKFDRMHTIKYDDVYNCDGKEDKKQSVKRLNKEINSYTWSSNIGMPEGTSADKMKHYDVDNRLLLYVYDNTYHFSFQFENIHSGEKREVSKYEVDFVELLEGENFEMVLKTVNHSTMPVNYLSFCITPSSLFNCYKVVHNEQEYLLGEPPNVQLISHHDEGQHDHTCRGFSHENNAQMGGRGKFHKNELNSKRKDLSIVSDMYSEEALREDTNVFRQKFKNKQIQHIKISGDISENDVFYLHVQVKSNCTGMHKCMITALCKHKNEEIKVEDDMHMKMKKKKENSLSYEEIFVDKKEKCFLFLRLLHIVPLVKLNTYLLNPCHGSNSFIYFFIHNLCRSDIYMHDIFLERQEGSRSLTMEKNSSKKSADARANSNFTKLITVHASNFVYLRRGEKSTALLCTTEPPPNVAVNLSRKIPQNSAPIYVHMNWVVKEGTHTRKGSMKKAVHYHTDIITLSVEQTNRDIYLNNQKEINFKIAINIQNNSGEDLTNFYVQAQEVDSMNSAFSMDCYGNEGGHHLDVPMFDVLEVGSDGGEHLQGQIEYPHKNDLPEDVEKKLPTISSINVNAPPRGDMSISNFANDLGSFQMDQVLEYKNLRNGFPPQCSVDEAKGEGGATHFSYASSLNDEISIAQNNMTRKIDLSSYKPISASYRWDGNFEVSMSTGLLGTGYLLDEVDGENEPVGGRQDVTFEASNTMEKRNLHTGKMIRRFHKNVRDNTYVYKNHCANTSQCTLLGRNLSPENVQKEKDTGKRALSLSGFVFMGIVQRYIKRLKKGECKKLYFNVLFTREGIYNINKFHVIFNMHNQTFMVQPLNQLIVQVHR